DGGNAHHDNERQHDRILDRRRAVFALDEIDDPLTELTHRRSPFGSLAIHARPEGGWTHGFAPPPYDGFAVSGNQEPGPPPRRKGLRGYTRSENRPCQSARREVPNRVRGNPWGWVVSSSE